MLNTSLPNQQTMRLFTKCCFVFSNVCSLRARSFDENVVLRFWNIIINFSCINVHRKTYVYYMKFGYHKIGDVYRVNVSWTDALQGMLVLEYM